jgi:TRAP-type C4-dicarboxylate transport system permease small subunit
MNGKIVAFLGKSLVLIMALRVLNVLWQVFSRYLLGSPSPFTEELARYLMIWVGLLGAAYASAKKMHVAIDILPSRAKPKTQKKLSKLVSCCIIAFALIALVAGGLRLVYISYLLGQSSPALQIPLAAVYSVIPVSGLLIVYFKINDLITP